MIVSRCVSAGPGRAAREVQKRLTYREPELPPVDLAFCDALAGAPL